MPSVARQDAYNNQKHNKLVKTEEDCFWREKKAIRVTK